MPLVKVKPTSAGRRGYVKVVTPELHKGKPHAKLLDRKSRTAGRNNYGHITTRHQSKRHKQRIRIVDFRRDKTGIPAKVERLEYDPNRSAHLLLLCYADGERRYIIAPKGVSAGMQLMSGPEAQIRPGNALALRNIPIGTTVHCIELQPGKGAQLARSAGGSAQLLAREGSYEEHSLEKTGKAGRVRWRGVRPTVRGVAMNPIDHPHGGGEGRTGTKRDPVSPWGKLTKGHRTRTNKRTRGMIIAARHKR